MLMRLSVEATFYCGRKFMGEMLVYKKNCISICTTLQSLVWLNITTLGILDLQNLNLEIYFVVVHYTNNNLAYLQKIFKKDNTIQ